MKVAPELGNEAKLREGLPPTTLSLASPTPTGELSMIALSPKSTGEVVLVIVADATLGADDNSRKLEPQQSEKVLSVGESRSRKLLIGPRPGETGQSMRRGREPSWDGHPWLHL